MTLRGLYVITPDDADEARFLERVGRALEGAGEGHWAALQYRNKLADAAVRPRQAGAVAKLARRWGVRMIVNDDVDLACALGADGVHLGADDGSLAAARRRLPGKLIGATCHDSIASARAAIAEGADHVAFGSVFASRTKPRAVRAPLALFAEARALGVPLVAIGGIDADNAAQVIRAGADAIAVIAAIFDAPDPALRARELARLFHSTRATPS
ncbi:MAG: thiamine-phosphate diphosphorylase [Betaproteobacteria bacterium RIFCSPLOWO2_02_FULL_66_14]|nr:MAG: thiamine-phosphate diphosphorylase [Betaproteobacteria bacterium RIFCSPLOWO2_02_FULL_66_14]